MPPVPSEILRLVSDFLHFTVLPELLHLIYAQKHLELPGGCNFINDDFKVDELLAKWDGIALYAPREATLCRSKEAALKKLFRLIAERLPTYATKRN